MVWTHPISTDDLYVIRVQAQRRSQAVVPITAKDEIHLDVLRNFLDFGLCQGTSS